MDLLEECGMVPSIFEYIRERASRGFPTGREHPCSIFSGRSEFVSVQDGGGGPRTSILCLGYEVKRKEGGVGMSWKSVGWVPFILCVLKGSRPEVRRQEHLCSAYFRR